MSDDCCTPSGKQMPRTYPKGKNPKAESFAATQIAGRSAPGMGSPPGVHDKSGAQTTEKQSAHSKEVTSEMLQFGQPPHVGPAPTSRLYTRDYSKVGREPDDVDLISSQLGNPLGL